MIPVNCIIQSYNMKMALIKVPQTISSPTNMQETKNSSLNALLL